MSRDDFCACYFDEFEAIAKAWRERQEMRSQESWEQCRMLALISIQPYLKPGRRITEKQLLQFPWDHKATELDADDELTSEERQKRFESLVAKAI